jgi:hypothetical protein
MRVRAALLLAGACCVPLLLTGSARANPGDLDRSFDFDGPIVVDGAVYLTTGAGVQAFRVGPPSAIGRRDPLDLRP